MFTYPSLSPLTAAFSGVISPTTFSLLASPVATPRTTPRSTPIPRWTTPFQQGSGEGGDNTGGSVTGQQVAGQGASSVAVAMAEYNNMMVNIVSGNNSDNNCDNIMQEG